VSQYLSPRQVMTHASARTWRISVYESALCFGLVLGTTTSGLIIDHLGIPALYGIIVGEYGWESLGIRA